MLSIGVRRHSAHALGAVLVQRVALDDPQASQRLVQDQATEIISDLLRLWAKTERRVKVRWNCAINIFLRTHFRDEVRRKSGTRRSALRFLTHIQSWGKKKGGEGEPSEESVKLRSFKSDMWKPSGFPVWRKGDGQETGCRHCRTGTPQHQLHFLGSTVH